MRLASVVLTLAIAVMLIADRASAETQRDPSLPPGASCKAGTGPHKGKTGNLDSAGLCCVQDVCVSNEGKTPEEQAQDQAIKRRTTTQPQQGLKATVAPKKAGSDRTGDSCTIVLDSGLKNPNGKCTDSKCSVCRDGDRCGAGDDGKQIKCPASTAQGRTPLQAAPGVKVTK